MRGTELQVPRGPFREATKETPDKIINLSLAFVIAGGTVFFGLLGFGMIYLGSKQHLWWIKATGISTCLAWPLSLVWIYRERLLYSFETWTGWDVTGDDVIGRPQQISIEISSADDNSLRYLHLPGTWDDFLKLARGITVLGLPFTQAQWTGRGAPYTRREWDKELIPRMFELGLICWKNPRAHTQGLDLTARGRSLFRKALEENGYSMLPSMISQERR